jgi:hypothetical protein
VLASPANATKKFFSKSSILSNVASSLNPTPSTASLDSSFVGSDPDSMDLLKRHKISLGQKSKKDKTHEDGLPRPAQLSIVVESPPLVSYGTPEESSGALFSGQFKIDVSSTTPITVSSIKVRLLSTTTVRKPAVSSCPDCSSTIKELKKWDFTKDELKKTLTPGEHKFPLSYLFAGDLPATTHCRLALLDYQFEAEVTTTCGHSLRFSHVVELQRAIRPGLERTSIRVFPPTNMTATVKHLPICYPNSEIPVSLRLAGINGVGNRAEFRWRIRRLLWRVEEYQKILSPCCTKHTGKCPEGQAGIKHEEVKIIGEGEVNFNKNPWKTDLSEGEIDSEFVASINPKHRTVLGTSIPEINLLVWHHLVIEMIVLEEYVPKKRPATANPTGAARILRSQFPLKVTNRAGLGVAWDEETPPVYQDVPPSPPGYQNGESSSLVATPPAYARTSVIDIDISSVMEDFHLGDPHPLAGSTMIGSSSTVTRRSSGSSSDLPPPQRNQVRWSEDDLLQEPILPRRVENDIEEDIDIQIAGPSSRG